jgi:hypothetical protein
VERGDVLTTQTRTALARLFVEIVAFDTIIVWSNRQRYLNILGGISLTRIILWK